MSGYFFHYKHTMVLRPIEEIKENFSIKKKEKHMQLQSCAKNFRIFRESLRDLFDRVIRIVLFKSHLFHLESITLSETETDILYKR